MIVKPKQVLDSVTSDPNSAASRFQAELKSRDEKISSLEKQVKALQKDRDNDMLRLNQKMELVMDEKDHQIRVNNS